MDMSDAVNRILEDDEPHEGGLAKFIRGAKASRSAITFYDLCNNFDYIEAIRSSMNCNYSDQEEEWTTVAEEEGLTLDELATLIASTIQEPGPGVEGLYELTRNEKLFPLTDYYRPGSQDQLCVSYFYTGPERLKHWEKCVKVTPEMLMSSTACALNAGCYEVDHVAHVDGATIRFVPPEHPEYWDRNDILIGLRKHGWDVEETVDKGVFTWTCHGRNYGKAVARLLDA